MDDPALILLLSCLCPDSFICCGWQGVNGFVVVGRV